jgi:precorrin-6B C5,15-methyltransferase / cobalt-precorrin-6B C5,C15-methyltransferase
MEWVKLPPESETRALNQSRWLSIVGIGEDGLNGLSPAARAIVHGAELVVGGKRHLDLVADIRAERLAWPSPLTDAIPLIEAARGRRVVVLASGDPFHYGVGVTLARHIDPSEILSVPAPSSFSLAASRLGWALQDTALVSLHGRPSEGIAEHLQDGAKILALTTDGETAAAVAAQLTALGYGSSRLTVLEALGGPRERIRSATAETFDLAEIDPLNILAVEVVAGEAAAVLTLAPGLDDDLFDHDGQLTKREVRAVTLAALAPQRGERLWDVGLGAGSVAIEWLRADRSLAAVGFEERPERAARAAGNAARLGVPQLEIVTGHAPESFAGKDAPDAIFLGGGAGDAGLFEAAWAALKPGGRLVANAVSLETEALLAAWFGRLGGSLTRLSVDRLVAVGTMHGWRPAMPVTQWRVVKPAAGA